MRNYRIVDPLKDIDIPYNFENLNIPRDPRRKKVLTTAPIKKAFRKALG